MEDTQKLTKEELRKGVKALWRHAKPFKTELTLLTILGLVSALVNGSIPYITGRFFDALIALSRQEFASVGPISLWAFLLALWVVIQFTANSVDWFMDRLRRKVDGKMHFKIDTDGFIHLFRLPLAFHKSAHINGVLQKISRTSWQMASITRTIIQFIPQFLSVVIGISLAATINPLLASILLIGVFLYGILLSRILIPVATIDSSLNKLLNSGFDSAAAAVHQIESVKQAGSEDYETKKVESALMEKAYGMWYRLGRVWGNVEFFQRAIVFGVQLTIFILSVQFISKGIISVGELIALNGYALMFLGPFVSLGYSWQTLQNGIISAAHTEEIFEEKEEVYQPAGAVSPEKISGKISFDHVYFRYSADHPEVLHDINFAVSPGTSVALVGESGVGKSTTISLISGYYFPSKGDVKIDGTPTSRFDLTALRKYIAVVPQEIALFNDTIKENIRYGSFSVTQEQIEKVVKAVHLDEFIDSLPQKYETLVGERGIKLSVGQKQRVAIARAMLRSPSILILDEPTSALDAKTEQIVTEALEKLMKGRTTFIIAHRLSTVRKADIILVFEKGKIVETGTHQELIDKKDGTYRRLYEYQIGLH